MNRLIGAAACCFLAAAFFLLIRGAAAAQGLSAEAARYLAPAMNLEDVPVAPGMPRLTVVTPTGNVVHLSPTYAAAMALARANPQTGIPPLIYHSGGETMLLATIHSIYWVPPTLQSGAPSAFGTLARELMYDLASDYHGHSIGNNNTQCYKIMTKTYYIQNAGAATKPVVDASSYPKSDCTDTLTSDNCILDSDIQAEIMKVMTVENWAAGSTALFVVHTAQGEGSCVSAGNCAYGQYCSYHSFINGSQPIIYAYIPYGSVKHCQAANTPSPNHQANVDAGINQLVATITNAITDPQMNAWFTSSGEESSELCAYNFEVASWDFNGQQYLANQFWNGHYYEVQTEPDNHTQSCVQVGP